MRRLVSKTDSSVVRSAPSFGNNPPMEILPRDLDEERPPICAACGVTMVPAELSAQGSRAGDWVCLECEESGELE